VTRDRGLPVKELRFPSFGPSSGVATLTDTRDEGGAMKLRRLAVSAAAVAILAGAGLAVSASPAAAMDDCFYFHRMSARAARDMDRYLGVDQWLWDMAYEVWLDAEQFIEEYDC
jgi:hypothetical protein